MNDARAIANFILDEFDSREHAISNKKINKLIYFAHGFSLFRIGQPLVKNHVEAWVHGPVFKVVYDAFKQFEFHPIVSRAVNFNFVTGVDEQVSYDLLGSEQRELTKKVVTHFVRFSADELEDMTHSQFGPWAKIWNLPESERGLRNRIPNEEIAAHFKLKYGQNPTTH